ncbi:MAG TPA: chorismate mutase [Planctomycetota bacterium]|nr:chorismate mutase [Planctomycetota bacterium]
MKPKPAKKGRAIPPARHRRRHSQANPGAGTTGARASSLAGIEQLRAAIDRLDAQLQRLLARRMAMSLKVASRKLGLGLPLRDLRREANILSQAAARVVAPLERRSVQAVMKKILEVTRVQTRTLKRKAGRG